MIDPKKFYAGIQQLPFHGGLNQRQVDGMNGILAEWESSGLTDLRWLAYMFATVLGECGHDMYPVREGFKKTDAEARAYVRARGYFYATESHGHVWYGRGDVQLTLYDNYLKMEKLTGLPLTQDPDLALVPKNAAKIMFIGMTSGTFTGHKLQDFFNAVKTDWVWARSIINGIRHGQTLPDRAIEIAQYGKQFYADLVTASN